MVSIFSKQISTYQKLVSHNFVKICPNLAKKSHGGQVQQKIKLTSQHIMYENYAKHQWGHQKHEEES